MYKYEFVSVDTVGKGLFSNKTERHREVIEEYAKKGWRYVGWFPSRSSNMLSGVIEKVDLIFEKEE